MGLQEQQNVLAKLVTDPKYRRAFLSEPLRIGVDAGLSLIEIEEIASIKPEELGFFSDSLFWKRRREVEKLLPLVRKVLNTDFDRIFNEFSAFYNPQSIKKHLEDAVEFCKYLDDHRFGLLARDSALFERTKLEFLRSKKRYAFCVLNHDFRAISNDLKDSDRLELKRRRTLALWLRIGRQLRHFVL
jgi:hypothetical protein